jgi:ABC-type transport system involved in cytochrome c biogenesis ATPase subunit
MATKQQPLAIKYKAHIVKYKAHIKGIKLNATLISRLDFLKNLVDQNEILIRAEVMQAELKDIVKIIKLLQKEQSKI